MSYKLTNRGLIFRIEDRAYIPADPTNSDYQEYLAWVAAGNDTLPVDPEPVGPDWKGFLSGLRTTTVFGALRQRARNNVQANALATELRTVLGEAALGFPQVEAIQGLVDELAPSLTPEQIAEIVTVVTANNIPLTFE